MTGLAFRAISPQMQANGMHRKKGPCTKKGKEKNEEMIPLFLCWWQVSADSSVSKCNGRTKSALKDSQALWQVFPETTHQRNHVHGNANQKGEQDGGVNA